MYREKIYGEIGKDDLAYFTIKALEELSELTEKKIDDALYGSDLYDYATVGICACVQKWLERNQRLNDLDRSLDRSLEDIEQLVEELDRLMMNFDIAEQIYHEIIKSEILTPLKLTHEITFKYITE